MDRMLCKSAGGSAFVVEGSVKLVGTQQVFSLAGKVLVHRPYDNQLGRRVPKLVSPRTTLA
jgi:hypothetical protein